MSDFIPEDLVAGEPVISVRWRLHKCALPLKNRHLHAFESRGLSAGLKSWARQHLEWTLAEGALQQPNGVMTLVVDEQGRAVMGVEAYEPLAACTAAQLVERADAYADDAVPGEVAWIARTGEAGTALIARVDGAKQLSGANSLVADLAKTLKMGVAFDPAARPQADDQVMLVSDEHGVVGASDTDGACAERFGAYYNKLVGITKPDAFDCGNLGIF